MLRGTLLPSPRALALLAAVAAALAWTASPAHAAIVGGHTLNEFPLPSEGSSPGAITVGADGALWFTAGEKIGRIPTNATPESSAGITIFPEHPPGGDPNSVTLGPEGLVWFTYTGEGDKHVGHIDLVGNVVEFKLEGEPKDLAFGPAGKLFITIGSGAIDEFDPVSGTPREMRTPGIKEGPGPVEMQCHTPNVEPLGIAMGPDGKLWFTAQASASIWTLVPAEERFQAIVPCPELGSKAGTGIVAGPDGDMWVAEPADNAIARVSVAGAVTEFPLPIPTASPSELVVGPDGAVWFTEPGANAIGRITTSGEVSEFVLPAIASQPAGIAAGRDGNIWFTEKGTNKIGELVLTSPPPPPAPPAPPAAPVVPPTLSLQGAPAVHGSAVTLEVSCAGSAGLSCAGSVRLQVVEHLKGRRGVTAVSAGKRHKRAAVKKRTVIVGSATFTLEAGHTAKVTVALNRTGRALLARFKRLPAKLILSPTGTQGKKVIVEKTVLFKAKRKKRKHH